MSVWCRHVQGERLQYKEREYSPRDYSRQLANLRWPVTTMFVGIFPPFCVYQVGTVLVTR